MVILQSIVFDISHGVTTSEVLDFFEKDGDDLESSDTGDKEWKNGKIVFDKDTLYYSHAIPENVSYRGIHLILNLNS
jgi:hypothetical protein